MSKSRKRRRNLEKKQRAKEIKRQEAKRPRARIVRGLGQSVRLNTRFGLMVVGAFTFTQGLLPWTNRFMDQVPFLLAGLGFFGLALLHQRFLR